MRKRNKISWKAYAAESILSATVIIAPLFGTFLVVDFAINYSNNDSDKSKTTINVTAMSLQDTLSKLSPEKLKEIKELYKQTYLLSDTSVKLDVKDKKAFDDLSNADLQITWRNNGDLAIKNDTVYIQDTDTARLRGTLGFTLNDFPQANIHYFKYNGKIKYLKKLSAKFNNSRFSTSLHEMKHISNFIPIIKTDISDRNRSIWAADELFAVISENLSKYATLKNKSAKWDKAFRTKVNIKDINYILPQKSQAIVDSAINSALDRLENDPVYRKTFIDLEKRSYDPVLEARAPNKTNKTKNAIKRMEPSFIVNGKNIELFNLASDKVKKRAEKFIYSNDDDMRLVMEIHKNKIRL